MRAGELRHYVTLQTPTRTNLSGEDSVSWGDEISFWANISAVSVSGDAYTNNDQIQSSMVIVIKCRYLFGIDFKTTKRIKYSWRGTDRYFSIQEAINVNEKDAQFELRCVEDKD